MEVATMKDKAKYEKGIKTMREVLGKSGADMMMQKVGSACPDFADYMAEHVYGDIYARAGLAYNYRQLAAVSALVAVGTAIPQLKAHIIGALNNGFSRQEIMELMIHLSLFVGVPAAMNGLFVAKELFEQLDGQGTTN
jgi:4-carboxymuconolactone decarboxylase